MSKLFDAMLEESEKEYQMQLEAERKQSEKIKKTVKDDEPLDDEPLDDESLDDESLDESLDDLKKGEDDNA